MDNNTFNARIAWQKAQENTNTAVSNVTKTAKAAHDNRNEPAYIEALAAFRKAMEAEKQAKTIYNSALAKQNFKHRS